MFSQGMTKLYIKKRSFSEILLLWIVFMPFAFGTLLDLFNLPNFIKYALDIAWIILLFLMVFNKSIVLHKWVTPAFITVITFLLYTFLAYIFNFQSPFYYLWGLRNNFRFYVFFFAVISYFSCEEADNVFKILEALFWINAAVSFIQYFVLGYNQDGLGGIFGTETGVNSYSIIFFTVVLSRSLLLYMTKREKAVYCFSKCSVALLVSALAELKVFFVIFIIILFLAAILTSFSWRKFILIFACVIVAMLASVLLTTLFDFDNVLSIKNIWELATQEHYTTEGTVNRLSAIPVLAKTLVTKLNDRLFGMGLGNCDTSAFSIFNTPFYQNYGHLRYSWFSCAFLFLEVGYVGILIYLMFFIIGTVLCFKRLKARETQPLFCQMAIIMFAVCFILFFYNGSLRTEAGYLIYFVLALPFLFRVDNNKIK